MSNILELKRKLKEIRAEINRQYWHFTRCANAKPVDSNLTRKEAALEKSIRLINNGIIGDLEEK